MCGRLKLNNKGGGEIFLFYLDGLEGKGVVVQKNCSFLLIVNILYPNLSHKFQILGEWKGV